MVVRYMAPIFILLSLAPGGTSVLVFKGILSTGMYFS